MQHDETTHRLATDGALCGEEGARWLSPLDSGVTCPMCRALISLRDKQRRALIARSVGLIARPGMA